MILRGSRTVHSKDTALSNLECGYYLFSNQTGLKALGCKAKGVGEATKSFPFSNRAEPTEPTRSEPQLAS